MDVPFDIDGLSFFVVTLSPCGADPADPATGGAATAPGIGLAAARRGKGPFSIKPAARRGKGGYSRIAHGDLVAASRTLV
jgi:hypothetical protein